MKGNSSIILTHDVMPNIEVLIKKKHIYIVDTDSVIERHFYEIFYYGIKVGINQFYRVANDEEALELHWFFSFAILEFDNEVLPREVREEIFLRYLKLAKLESFLYEDIGLYDYVGYTRLPRKSCGKYFIEKFLKHFGGNNE